jgi:hypothetical protein
MKRREILKTGAASTAVLGFPAILKAQQTYRAEYKMSTVVGPALAWGKAGENFGNYVREGTKGRINIKQYPGSSLVQGQQDREFSAMRQGIIDVLCGAPINWSGTVRECGAFALPFLMPDHKAYDAVLITSEPVLKDFFDIIRKAGAEPLAIGETGYRQLSNSKRAVRKPEDLKGLKIRIVASPMYQEIMTGMGANPTAMSWADAQPALASSAVDGQENPMEIFLALRPSARSSSPSGTTPTTSCCSRSPIRSGSRGRRRTSRSFARPPRPPPRRTSARYATASPRTSNSCAPRASTSWCRPRPRWKPGRSPAVVRTPAGRHRSTRR